MYLKLMNNDVFSKMTKNVKNVSRLVTIEKKNYLVSEPICNSMKWLSKTFLAIEITRTKVNMNKLVWSVFPFFQK